MKKKKQVAFKREKKNRASFFIIFSVVMIFCGYLLYRSIDLIDTKSSLETDIATISDKLESEEKRSEELKQYETYTHTKKYAEDVAKDVLGYVKEDEIIFKPE